MTINTSPIPLTGVTNKKVNYRSKIKFLDVWRSRVNFNSDAADENQQKRQQI